MNLQRQDPVVFHFHGRDITGKVIQIYNEFNAIRCEDMKGLDYLLAPSDVMSVEDFDKKKEQDRIEAAREKYQDLIDAWTLCDGDTAAIAAILKVNPRSIGSRIAAAKRRGFIK